jgi:murein L,D-transpeptidase YafK
VDKEESVRGLFFQKKLPYPPKKVFIRIFKREKKLELWVGQENGEVFAVLKEYGICSASGHPGPKRQEGDWQVPEGFYFIDGFNPASQFYLSLRISYPNKSDRVLGVNGRLGGDIFIHGDCVSIGCAAMTDERIKEIYLIVVEAKSAGQRRIPVHIFPTRLDQDGMVQLRARYSSDQALLNFWENLKEGYDYFEEHRRVPTVRVDQRGRYVIRD